MPLDLEIVAPPQDDGTDIVSVKEQKVHLRIHEANTSLDADIKESLLDAGGNLRSQLNRTIFPTTLRRYLPSFRRCSPIQLPYPDLIEIVDVGYKDSDGVDRVVSAADYLVRTIDMIPQVEILSGKAWPSSLQHQRAVWITYRAGYNDEYPPQLRRLVKMQAANYLANKEATLNDGRFLLVSRKVEFGMENLIDYLRVPVAYDDWD